MLKQTGFFLFACALLSACASSYVFTPLALEGTESIFDRGTPQTTSIKPKSFIKIRPLGVDEKMRVVFSIVYENKEDEARNFGVENVAVSTSTGTELRVWRFQELVREAKNAAAWAALATALSGAGAALAAQQNAYSTTTGTIYGTSGISTFQARSYDPTAAAIGTAAATAGTAVAISQINKRLDEALDHYSGTVLQTTTLTPGQVYGGDVYAGKLPISKGRPVDIFVTVTIGEEVHRVGFQVNKEGG